MFGSTSKYSEAMYLVTDDTTEPAMDKGYYVIFSRVYIFPDELSSCMTPSQVRYVGIYAAL
jgi:hypothetical protein